MFTAASDAFLDDVDAEVDAISAGESETSLIAMAPGNPWTKALHESFPDFMSFGWILEDHLRDRSALSHLQIALFHPLAVRNLYGSGDVEAEDYAMRSPHPTVHLLRVADVQAVPTESAAAVPERNRVRLRGLGVEMLVQELQDIQDDAKRS